MTHMLPRTRQPGNDPIPLDGSARVSESRSETLRNPPQGLPDNRIVTGNFDTRPGYSIIRDRGTSDWLLIFTIDGAGEVGGAGEYRRTGPGDFVAWPAGQPQRYRLAPDSSRWAFLWAHCIPWPHWHTLLAWPAFQDSARGMSIADPGARSRIAKLMLEMHEYAQRGGTAAKTWALNALERALLVAEESNPLVHTTAVDERVRRATYYLEAHAANDDLSLDMLAGKVGISKSRLSHLFTTDMGVSPMQYLETQRLNYARTLLSRTPLSIVEVARICGFTSASYFTRRFTRAERCSPSEFRRKFG